MEYEYTLSELIDFMHNVEDWKDTEVEPMKHAVIQSLEELKAIRAYIGLVRNFDTHNLYLEELKKMVH